MDVDNLVHMANRIGEFFQTMPDPEAARKDIAEHIHKFWEPRMRRLLIAKIDADGAPHMMPLVREAVLAHRAELQPNPDWTAHQVHAV